MPSLDGAILVVHGDRKLQRLITRVLGVVGRGVVALDDLAAAAIALRDGTPALLVMSSQLRVAREADALVELVLARGGLACLVVHDDHTIVPATLFQVASLAHLTTAAMPVLAEELFVTAQKLLRGDRFGPDKYLAWGATGGTTEIVSTDDRLRAVEELAERCEAMNLGRRHIAAITLAADELVLNAIHDAPIDERGARYLLEVPRDAARPLTGRERPELRWACDGRWFSVTVRDHFGSVDAATLVRYLAKSVTRHGQVRTDGPGAGIGLAMTASAVAQLVFDVDPDRCTEVTALVDLRPWPPTATPPLAGFHLFFPQPPAPAA